MVFCFMNGTKESETETEQEILEQNTNILKYHHGMVSNRHLYLMHSVYYLVLFTDPIKTKGYCSL